MRKETYYICSMQIIQDFYDEVDEKIQEALAKRRNGCVSVERTAYAEYCLRLLQNNG